MNESVAMVKDASRRGHQPVYDVFLSYNSRNRPEAQILAKALKSHGLNVFWDRDYLNPGTRWIPALEEALESSKAFVVLNGPEGLGRWQRLEVEVALDRQVEGADVQVVPALLPRAMPLPRFLKLNTWVDFPKGMDDREAIEFLVSSLGGRLATSVQESHSESVRAQLCPYRGLASFREDDAEFFFGREAVIAQLMTALGKGNFVALVGSSGSGKSSVVHAGLIPRLRQLGRETFSDFAFMKPTDKPFEALAACLFPVIEPKKMGIDKVRAVRALAAELESGAVDLASLIAIGRENLGSSGKLLLVVDQWEELYTLCSNSPAPANFLTQLHEALEKDLLSVVCTIREDFVPLARDATCLGDRFESSRVYLHRMHFDDLRLAIEAPAERVGLTLEEGLAERILDDLGDEPGQLPLLEFVLTELWKRRQNGVLRHDSYEELGGGRKAIAAKAEEVFNQHAADQSDVRSLFLLLVRPGEGTQDTRRRASLAEIGEAGRKVMAPLVDARLLTTSLEPEEQDEAEVSDEPTAGTLEITHEALITHWDRLRKWLSEDRNFLLWRDKLRLAHSSWQQESHDEGFLLTRAPLAEAEEWLERRRHDLNVAEVAFIERSLAKRQQELEREVWEEQEARERDLLRRKQLLWVVSVAALVFLCFALFGLWRWRMSLSRALAAEAIQLQNGPLDVALLLSVEAGNVRETLEAQGSLLSLLERSPELQAFLPGHKERVARAAFSPDGRRFATAGTDEIFLWDAETGKRVDSSFHGHAGPVLDLAFSPDGSVLASCGKDRTIRLWRVGDHQPLRPPIDLTEPVRNLGFSPDGKLLVASQGGSILLWGNPSLAPRGRINAHKVSISRLVFRSDGLLAASSYDGTISLWNLDSREKVRTLSGHQGQVLDIAFSPDGKTLASGGWDKTIRLWDSETGNQLGEPVAAHRDAVLSIAFSTDGTTLASSGLDKVIHLWSIANSRLEPSSRFSKTLVGHGKGVWTLAFGKADRLVSGGDEASAILWNLQAPPRFSVQAQLSAEIDSVAFSPDGALVATGGNDGIIRLWDTVSGRLREPVFQSRQGSLYGLALREGKLYSAGEDGRILIWNMEHPRNEPEELLKADGTKQPQIFSLALSPDGKTLAAGDELGRVRLWQVAGSQYLGEMPERDRGAISGLSFSPDGLLLCAGGVEGLIRVWDAKSRRMVTKPLKGHDSTVTGLAFDPAGQTLASSSTDRTVQLWDVKSWTLQKGSPLTGPENFLTSVAFSPKGDRLAASVLDGSIFLWDVKHRLPIGSGLHGTGKAFSVAFHPNGRYLAVGTESSLLLFDLHNEAWRDQACRIAGRNLTSQEWSKYLPYEPYRKTCPDLH